MLAINDLRKIVSRSFPLSFYSLAALSGVFLPVNAHATQYYIDNSNPAACSDSGGGTTQTAPWCDFNTFNTTTFNPGDTISLKKGDTWNPSSGTLCGTIYPAVCLQGSGSSGNPITLNSYGSGPQPIIEYGSSTSAVNVIYGVNLSYWTIENLDVEVTSTVTFDKTFATTESSAIDLFYTGSPTYSGITISNNTIHGSGTSYNNGLVTIFGEYTSGRTSDVVDNITIADNMIHDGGGWLVYVAGCTVSACNNNMTYYTGGGYGNLQFYGNTAYNSAMQGVVITAALNSSIYDNLVHDTGLYTSSGSVWKPVALWSLGSYNTSFYNNEVYNSGSGGTGDDASGIDVDWDNSYVTVYGNYLHDNTGPGSEVLSSDHTTIEWNRIYNNEQSTNGEPAQIALNDFADGHLHGITNATIAGNIIVLNTSGSTGLSTNGTSGYTWDNNYVYWNLESFVASSQAYNLEVDGYGQITSSDYNHFDDGLGAVFSGTLDGTPYTSLTGSGSWCSATTFDCGSYLGDASGDWEAWADWAPPNHTSHQWSYNYSTNGESSYSAATWDESGQYWYGTEAYCWIESSIDTNVGTPMMSPGGNLCDAVLTWTAPSNGSVYIGSVPNITVWAGTTGCGGDGVNLRILKNTTQIWPTSGPQYIANGGSYTFPGVSGLSVSSGDTLNFVVAHNGSNNYCDHTSWNPVIFFY